MGGSDNVIEGLVGRFPAIADRMAQDNPFSQEVQRYLKNGMAQVQEMKRLRITGSRTVAVELTTIAQVKPNFIGLLTAGGGSGLNAGMLWFNVIALRAAYNNLQTSDAPEYTTGFAASIFGVMGAAAATLVSARAAQKAVMLRVSSTLPGMGFGNGVIQFLGSNLFARLAGYPAIMLTAISDTSKAKRQKDNGDLITAAYTLAGGAAMSIGSTIVLEAGLAIFGITSIVPFAGWAAAALVLAGASIIAGGLYLHALAHERLHTPIELWAARSIFGNRDNDGEIRTGVALDLDKKLPRYPTPLSEVEAWYHEHYDPKIITAEQAQSLGVRGVDTRWHENNHWAPPNWTAIVHNEVATTQPTIEFTALLPGFSVGVSEWSGHLSSAGKDLEIEKFPATLTCHIVAAGLIVHFKSTPTNLSRISLHLTHSTNQGLHEKQKIHSTFSLER